MIVIDVMSDTIKIRGHAEYEPKGKDIVCAAVSTLFQVMVFSIEELTEDRIEYNLSPADAFMKYESLSTDSNLDMYPVSWTHRYMN